MKTAKRSTVETQSNVPVAKPALTLGQLASAVDRLAPYRLAYDWDNVGLQVGDPAAPVSRVLVALEVTDASIAAAKKHSCSAIIAHHPLIFRAAKKLRSDDLSGRLVMELVRAGIGLIAAHTNLDRVLRGTNGALAALLQLRDPAVLDPAENDHLVKFTVFVPRTHTPKLIEAIHRGGGGRIGHYSHCTFSSPGTGTFLPEEGSHPTLGRIGNLEHAQEDRLETVVERTKLRSVLQEVRQAHPYEQVAFDVFPLHDADPKFGLGAVGSLVPKTTLRALANAAARAVGADFATFVGAPGHTVRRVAVITGSAGDSIKSISPSVADAVVTGELSYHFAQEAVERGIGVVCVGHAASERIVAKPLCDALGEDREIRAAGTTLIPFDNFPEPFRLAIAGKAEPK